MDCVYLSARQSGVSSIVGDMRLLARESAARQFSNRAESLPLAGCALIDALWRYAAVVCSVEQIGLQGRLAVASYRGTLRIRTPPRSGA